jgi:hypothetical protein
MWWKRAWEVGAMLIKDIFKRALLMMCPVLLCGLILFAGFFRPQVWAQGQGKTQVYAGKKIRILIRPFTYSRQPAPHIQRTRDLPLRKV